MATPAQRRLLQDYQKIKKSIEEGLDATPDEDNLLLWEAVIFGPIDTIWEGGTFRMRIEFTEEYPNNPPHIYFRCRMFHPNIYNDGKICLDSTPLLTTALQKNWSHMIDTSALLTMIRSLLADPNTDLPANQEAARLYNSNLKEYEKRVRDVVEMSWKTSLTL